MRGLRQLKKQNANNNERRANWNAFLATAAKIYQLKNVFRQDLITGEVTESSRSKMNAEVRFWYMTFEPLKNVPALPQSVAWEALEKGAILFTATAKFWIENSRPVPLVQQKPKTKLCKTDVCNRSGNPAVKDDLCVVCYERQAVEWSEAA